MWGESWSYGDTGRTPVLTGQGVMTVVLILDEVRQMITDLLLPSSGQGKL